MYYYYCDDGDKAGVDDDNNVDEADNDNWM